VLQVGHRSRGVGELPEWQDGSAGFARHVQLPHAPWPNAGARGGGVEAVEMKRTSRVVRGHTAQRNSVASKAAYLGLKAGNPEVSPA